MAKPLLKLEDVNVYYGNVHALKGITLEVYEGELITLLGGNGAGKSTTLMTISGILRPRSGRVTFEDRDLGHSRPDDIVQLGVIQCPEGRRIFGGLTVRENLRMGASRRRDRKAVQEDTGLGLLALPDSAASAGRRAGATLSGGRAADAGRRSGAHGPPATAACSTSHRWAWRP